MNSAFDRGDPQEPHPFRFQCIGCGSPHAEDGSGLVKTNRDGPADYAMLCATCTPRMADPRFRVMIEIAAVVRVSHAAAMAALARMRANPPRSFEGFVARAAETDEALGLPAGSAMLVLGEFAARSARGAV